jgi:hypothetical protein
MIISEDGFRNLCAVSDRVFRDLEVNDFLVAIPYLHIIRAHPVPLEKYKSLFSPAKTSLYVFLKSKFSRLKFSAVLAKSRIPAGGQSSKIPYLSSGSSQVKLDFLFVSHFLNTSQWADKDDFYYGDLPGKLARKGFKVGIVYINHTRLDGDALTENWNNDGISRYFLQRSVPAEELKRILDGMAAQSACLAALARNTGAGSFYAGFCDAASRDALSGTTRGNLVFSANFRKLVDDVSPGLVLFTHEGHALERLVCARIHEHGADCAAVGYIHAALFATQNSMLRKLPDEYCPDHVLTTGEIALNQLLEGGYYLSDRTGILGSHKINFASGQLGMTKENICMVLPEGLVEECVVLFSYSLRIAAKFPHIRFVWRLHPLVKMDDLMEKFSEFRSLPDNVSLSKQDFETDLQSAKWALYRGSTAIVPALAAGVRPLYVSQLGEINIDPLHRLEKWKVTIKDVQDLSPVFENGSEGNSGLQQDSKAANEYSRKFYHPFDMQVLEEILPARQ